MTTGTTEIGINPETVVLKDERTKATFFPVYHPDEVPAGLVEFLCDEFNQEVERGDSYPHMDKMNVDQFKKYWFVSFVVVFIIGEYDQIPSELKWEEKVLGTFYIKPNYPGRCAHNCNAGFVVNECIRNKGVGRKMGEQYVKWAPRLGYTYSVFNLVFATNTASIKIWESLGFEQIGKIKGGGKLKGYKHPVDAYIYGKDLAVE